MVLSQWSVWWRKLRALLFPVMPLPPPIPDQTHDGLLSAVNAFRHVHGYPPYAASACLAKQAAQHCRDVAAGLNRRHVGFPERANACNLGYAGENEAWGGVRDAQHAVELWAASPDHLENMLRNYNQFGGMVVNGAAVMLAGTVTTAAVASGKRTVDVVATSDSMSAARIS